MQCTRFKKSLLVSSIAATMWTMPPVVHAATVLEEVVVTARKRQESLQETPVAITAMSGDQLQAQGVTSTADLRAVVPNVDIYGGNGTTGAANIFIRGVGARNTGVNYDSGVGIYLDNVYLSRPDGAVMDNVDIANLEVLRGPQGTLFGKNTTGGAIIYTTNKPTDKFEGSIDLRGGNYSRRDGKVTVNAPLIEDLLNSRFSLYSTRRDGTVTNKYQGDNGALYNQKLSDEDRMGAQAHFLLLASDDVTVDFNNFYSKTDQMARGQKCQFVQGSPGAGWQAGLQDAQVIIPSTGQSIADHCRDNEDLDIDDVISDQPENKYFSENYTSALSVDWDINDSLSAKSVTAYRVTRAAEANDLDAMGIPLLSRTNYGAGTSKRNTTQISQEFQLSGNAFDEKLDYVTGLYYFTEKSKDGASAGITGPFFGVAGIPTLGYYTNNLTQLNAKNWSGSIFSQADWKFNDQWTLTGGLRYTTESRKLRRTVDDVDLTNVTLDGSPINAVSPPVYFFPGGAANFNPRAGYVHNFDPFLKDGEILDANNQKDEADNHAWTPMVSLQRTFEDVGFIETGSAYITYSKGFLSGGLSEAADPISQAIFEYDPEKVANYEIGFKFDALDRRVRVNTALFYMDYKDRQLTTVTIDPSTGRIAGVPINAAKSNIKGIEIESQLIPMDNMLITANVTFNKGEIKKFDDNRIVSQGALPGANCQSIPISGGNIVDYCPIDRSNEDLPRLPKAVYFGAIQYTFNTPIGDIIPRLQASLRTDVDNCFDVSSCESGIYKVNQRDISARLTWMSPEKDWSITAFGTNLGDHRYIIGGTPLVDVTQTAGTVYNDPKMYGAELHYSW